MSNNRKNFRKAVDSAIKNGDFYTAGKLYLHEREFHNALRTFEEGRHFGEMIEIAKFYEQNGRAAEALRVYEKTNHRDGQLRIHLKKKNVHAIIRILKEDNRLLDAAAVYAQFNLYKEAAEIYESKGISHRAAECYEKADNLQKAAENYEKWYHINSDTNDGYCQLTQNNEELDKAVELYVKIGKREHAYQLLDQYHKHEKAGPLALELKKYDKAIAHFQSAQMPLQAAEVYEMQGKMNEAFCLRGEYQLTLGNKLEAADYFEKGGSYSQAAELYQLIGNHWAAAKCFEKNKNFLVAADNYFKCDDKGAAAEMYEKGGVWKMAADLYLELGKHSKAGELFEKASEFLIAGDCFKDAGDYEQAIHCYQAVHSASPEYEDALEKMGELLLQTERAQLAAEQIEVYLENQTVAKHNLHLYYILALAYQSSRRYIKAHKILSDILRVDLIYKDVEARVKDVEELLKHSREKQSEIISPSRRYHIHEKIGQGGMGCVYKAEDTVLKRDVALKILNEKYTKEAKDIESLMAEARSMASLSHDNIVTVHDMGQMGDDYFISMEFIDGVNFMEIIKSKKVLSVSQILFVAVKLFKALHYSHTHNVIHRDIKPHNIMMSRKQKIKILDFGIAVIKSDEEHQSKVRIGTPHYMSPEQIQRAKVDHRTDLYSAGVTLFNIVTGRVPYAGDNVLDQHLNAPIPRVEKYRPDISEKLSNIIYKCMEKKANNRFQSAQEILFQMGQLEESDMLPSIKKETMGEQTAVTPITGLTKTTKIVEPSNSTTLQSADSSSEIRDIIFAVTGNKLPTLSDSALEPEPSDAVTVAQAPPKEPVKESGAPPKQPLEEMDDFFDDFLFRSTLGFRETRSGS